LKDLSDIEQAMTKIPPLEHGPVLSLVAVTQTAVGCGVGLLLAGKLGRTAQRTTALALFSVGVISTVPLVVDLFAKHHNRPESERGMRRRLESIREDSGFSEDAEVF
jgi:hypothetical protein